MSNAKKHFIVLGLGAQLADSVLKSAMYIPELDKKE